MSGAGKRGNNHRNIFKMISVINAKNKKREYMELLEHKIGGFDIVVR